MFVTFRQASPRPFSVPRLREPDAMDREITRGGFAFLVLFFVLARLYAVMSVTWLARALLFSLQSVQWWSFSW
jgi:hypothetical protein